MPEIRPFRALRYDRRDDRRPGARRRPALRRHRRRRSGERLLARHPANVVRLDLPGEEPGDEPDDRYRRAARTLAAWRSDGTLHKDPHPSIYVYEQTYRVPGTDVDADPARLLRAAPARAVRAGRRACCRTSGRWPARARTATSCCARPGSTPARSSCCTTIRQATGAAGPRRGRRARAPDVDIVDDDGVRHRLWAVPADGERGRARSPRCWPRPSRGPVTIADGHHRYETALRYRDERRMSRSCEEDPAFDYLLTLFLEATRAAADRPADPPGPARPGRRRRGRAAGPASTSCSRSGAASTPASSATRFDAIGLAAGGAGRFGLWTRSRRRDADRAPGGLRAAACPRGGAALRGLDVTLLGVALERLAGLDAEAVAGGAVAYTKSAAEAIDAVDRRGRRRRRRLPARADARSPSIAAVARDGDVMPQKSTYFYPKALTGLVINPHEW